MRLALTLLLLSAMAGSGDVPVRIETAPGAETCTGKLIGKEFAASPGCWAAPVEFRDGKPATIRLWPAATIVGGVDGDANAVDLRIRSVPGVKPAIDSTIRCAVSDRRWTCAVPAVELDLRVAVAGFIPRYFWNVHAAPGTSKDLGRIVLVRGASVCGWVETPAGAAAEATVELIPESGLPEQRMTALSTLKAKANGRGFFQFTSVPEARYSVAARRTGWSPVRLDGIEVARADEHLLRGPLRLEPLAELRVSIDPPADPDGKPWTVRLARPGSEGWVTIAQTAASADGIWMKTALEARRYELAVTDSRGSVHHREALEVTSAMPPLHVRIERVAVRGKVTAGNEPLGAVLTFSSGGSKVRVESDEEGSYSTTLPSGGAWTVQVMPKTMKLVIPRIAADVGRPRDGGVAIVDIELPGGTVEGTVVDEQGEPVDADVRIVRGQARESYTITDGKGAFRLVAVEPGPVTLEVVSVDRIATSVPYLVGKGDNAPVRIVVERKIDVKGRLVTRSGAPIAGALVRYVVGAMLEESSTGPDGAFRIPAPRSAPQVDAVIIPIGFATKVVTLTAGQTHTVVADANPAQLTVRVARTPWPFLRREGGGFLNMGLLLYRTGAFGPPDGLVPGGMRALLEAGAYTLCPEPRLSERCESRTLAPGTATEIDLRQWRGEG